MRRLPTWALVLSSFSRSFSLLAVLALLIGCTKSSEVSKQKARGHVELLAKAAHEDVLEVQKGLPLGAKQLEAYFAEGKAGEDAVAAKEALQLARNRVRDLRTAKSTFFLVASTQGVILRSDLEHDALAGKNLFAAFGELKAAVAGPYTESRGSMAEAAGVRGRSDGQWVAATPIMKGAEVAGLYATGWSWSAYAYRLENQLRSAVKSEARDSQSKEALVYVYVVVDTEVYGAPISPDVTAKAIKASGLLGRATGEAVVDAAQEIEGRDFGLALRRVPALGRDVAIAVVRSET
ncbi:MAG TPA: hypothetical protein VIW29_04225 [Polyangiaceae bacterium]